jgi:mono/diheme cytochrome c family protein
VRALRPLSFLAFALAAGPALAADDGMTAGVGRTIAETWCRHCHAIAPGETISPVDAAPSFWVMSQDPAVTELALSVLLRTPHATMPNIRFSPEEVSGLSAFIHGLRQTAR